MNIMSEKEKYDWKIDRLIHIPKELYKEYYTQLRSGDTNMGYEVWKLTSEVLKNNE